MDYLQCHLYNKVMIVLISLHLMFKMIRYKNKIIKLIIVKSVIKQMHL